MKAKIEILVSMRFGKLIVLSEVEKAKDEKTGITNGFANAIVVIQL